MAVPKRIALDTSVLIKHLRGGVEADLVASLQEKAELSTTIVNAFELYYGAYKTADVKVNLAAAKGLLSTLEVLALEDAAAEKSGEVLAHLEARGEAIDSRDLFTGCIALTNGYAVFTHNPHHFRRIPRLQVLTLADLR